MTPPPQYCRYPGAEERETPYRSSIMAGVVLFTVNLALAWGGWRLLSSANPLARAGGLALLLGCAISVLRYIRRGGTAFGPCPNCGAEVVASRREKSVICRECLEYIEVSGRVLRLQEESVAEEPTFRLIHPCGWQLPGNSSNLSDPLMWHYFASGPRAYPLHSVWPNRCAVCGAEPTRWDSQELRLDLDGILRLGRSRRRVLLLSIDRIPHCAIHRDGVRLATSRAPAAVLYFRSLRYRNEFRGMKPAGTDPRRLADTIGQASIRFAHLTPPPR